MHIAPPTQTPATRDLLYDPLTIALHWTTAVLIGLLWLIGQTVDFAPSGPLRVDYRSLHILFGVTLFGVFVARVTWRLRRGRSLPGVGDMLMELVARLTHWALYLLILSA